MLQHQVQQTQVAEERVSPGGAVKDCTDYHTNEFFTSEAHRGCLRVREVSRVRGDEATITGKGRLESGNFLCAHHTHDEAPFEDYFITVDYARHTGNALPMWRRLIVAIGKAPAATSKAKYWTA